MSDPQPSVTTSPGGEAVGMVTAPASNLARPGRVAGQTRMPSLPRPGRESRAASVHGLARRSTMVLALLAPLGGCHPGAEPNANDTDPSSTDGQSSLADSTGDDESFDPGECHRAPLTPWRQLTRTQYVNTIRDLLELSADVGSFPDDGRAGPFASNVDERVGAIHVQHYMLAAEDLSARASLSAVSSCAASAGEEPESCADETIRTFGRRAFRRPLEDKEVQRYRDRFDPIAAGEGFEAAVRMLVRTMLQAPDFLYLVEVGDADDPERLSDWELASRLSYLLWSSMPDSELLAVAEDGSLGDPEVLEQQALRLLSDARAADTLGSFHRQWLGAGAIRADDKDEGSFPEFDDARVAAMSEEQQRMVEHVVLEADGDLAELLTASFTFVDDALAAVYGIDDGGSGWRRVELDPDERAGLLTQAGFLAAHAGPLESSLVRRGRAVREAVLCEPVPPPPPDVDTELPPKQPGQSPRDRWEEHLENPSCAGCHRQFDPLGFGLEHYDAIGRWRTTIDEWEVDANGELAGVDGGGAFEGAVELAGMLSRSEDVHACYRRQWLRFATGRALPKDEPEPCAEAQIESALTATGGTVRELLVAIVMSDAFQTRGER